MIAEPRSEDLARALDELIPPQPPLPGLAAHVQAAGRRRRRRKTAVAAGLLTLVVTGSMGLAAIRHDVTSARAASAAQRTEAKRMREQGPPAIDRSRPHLVLNPPTVPASGADVAILAANPTDDNLVYGLDGTVDRWTGSSWRRVQNYVAAPTFWGSIGSLSNLNKPVLVRGLGVSARAHRYSVGAIWIHISGLEPGMYRISNTIGSGILEVAPSGPAPASVRPTPLYLGGPESVIAGQTTTVQFAPAASIRQDMDMQTTLGQIVGPARITRLSGSTWSSVVSVPIGTGSPPNAARWAYGPLRLPFWLQLPALTPGTYRITVSSSRGIDVTGVFWALPRLDS